MSTKSELNESTESEPSEVQKFYDGLNIFVTGGSGFLGHLLIQKLIRDCPNISKIYLLIRPKKGKTLEERFEKMFENYVFDKMKAACPEYADKIKFIMGDLLSPCLGLSEDDKKLMADEINVVFHLAATTSFDEKIRVAAAINTRATVDLVAFAKTMTNLKAFVYCSTAFSNCNRLIIDEVIYDMPHEPEEVFQIIDILSDEELAVLNEKLLSGLPNTYTFTKCLAENMIKENAKGMPITIVRPSIVTSSAEDPLGGWANNFSGAIGISCVTLYGMVHVIECKKDAICDIIPGDYVVNNIIVAAQYIGTTFNNNINKGKNAAYESIKTSHDVAIFNCTTGRENPITWNEFRSYGYTDKANSWAPIDAVWYYYIIFCTNEYVVRFLQLLLELLPAYIIDFTLLIRGKKTKVVRMLKKIHYYVDLIEDFTCKHWTFINNNNQALWNGLNSTDKKLFKFCVRDINWAHYFTEEYAKGLYLYVIRKPVDQLSAARARYRILKYLHYTIVYSLYAICAVFIYKIFKMCI